MNADILFTKLPDDPAGCGWYDTLPRPLAPERLTGDQTADWVVLGGGFAGLAAARRLAVLLPEARIVLIDAQRIGFGSAGRNSGFMIDLPHNLTSESYTGQLERDRQILRRNREAINFMREIVQTHDIACDWREQGKIHAAAASRGTKALAEFARGLDLLGEPYTRLTGEDLQRITGSDYYRAGMHTPGTVLVQPAALVRGLARTMPENVQVYENSPVTRISPGRTIRLQSPGGTLKTAGVILANNGYAAQCRALRGRLISVFTYGSMTRPLVAEEQKILGGEENWGIIPADPLGTTVRRLGDNRLLIRNTVTYNPNYTSSKSRLKTIRRRHEKSLRRRFPNLPDLDFEYTWGGALSLSRNSVPCFGRVMPGIHAAVCQNGLGVAGGTISGKLIAEYVCGGDSESLRSMLSESTPVGNVPRPLLDLGVRGSILWKEWRSGAEI